MDCNAVETMSKNLKTEKLLRCLQAPVCTTSILSLQKNPNMCFSTTLNDTAAFNCTFDFSLFRFSSSGISDVQSQKTLKKKQQQKTLLQTLFTLFQIFPHVSSSWPAETKRKKRLISLFISFTVVKSHGIVMKYESHKTKIVPRRRLHQLSPRLLGLQTAPSSS